MKRLARRWIIVVVLFAFAPVALTSCYGTFPLTNLVYEVNGEIGGSSVGGRVLRQIVFWVFIILPVYSIAMLGDAIIFNLIEFWTGAEFADEVTYVTEDGRDVALRPGDDGDTAILEVSEDGRTLSTLRFTRVDKRTCAVYDANDARVGSVFHTVGGDLKLTDAKGRTVRTIDARDISRLQSAFARTAAE